jgi:hypothetical protein
MAEGGAGSMAVIHRNYIRNGCGGRSEVNPGNDWSKEACEEDSSKEV